MVITLLLILHTLIAAALVGVILLQRSEGGGLGIGQTTGGLVSARSAGDLLTRSTSLLAAAFVVTSLVLAILYKREGATREIDASAADRAAVPTQPAAPVQAPPAGVPLFPAAPAAAPGAPTAVPGAPVPVPGATGSSTEAVPLFPTAPAEAPPAQPAN